MAVRMDNDFEETLEAFINEIEGDGGDLTEEVAEVQLTLQARPDILVSISFVDKATEDSFNEMHDLMGRLQ